MRDAVAQGLWLPKAAGMAHDGDDFHHRVANGRFAADVARLIASQFQYCSEGDRVVRLQRFEATPTVRYRQTVGLCDVPCRKVGTTDVADRARA